MREEFEYRCVNFNATTQELEHHLNSFGSEGWELVTVTTGGTYIFKRLRRYR